MKVTETEHDDDFGPAPVVARIRAADLVAEWAPVAAVIIAIGLAYRPNLQSLFKTWMNDPDYSHGFLVIPIALVIIWKNWPGLVDRSPSLVGWGLVIASLSARLYLHNRGSQWSETATLYPLILGLGLARLGWKIFSRVWPGFVFLIFLFPLPASLNSMLSQPLQKLATVFSVALLKGTGLWVMAEGNVIMVDSERLEVQEACNGLAMLMSLAATVVAAASLIPMSYLKRLILLVSVIPVALLSNILRISATAWCYHSFGAEVGSKYAHDLAGWLMMPTAMALVALELTIVSWLIVETPEETNKIGLVGMGRGVPNIARELVMIDRSWIWGVPLSHLTRKSATEAVMAMIDRGRPAYFITANVHYAMLTEQHPELGPINRGAELILADGAPLVWASRFREVVLPERVAGSDLVYDLCEKAAELGHGVFLLGAAPGIADEAARRLVERYPRLRIAGTACPEPDELTGEKCQALIEKIRASQPGLLMVAFGQPKGERWISENLEALGVPACVQVGATLDFVAGRMRRAPRFYQKIGMEWAYRMAQEPGRLVPRYSRNILFILKSIARDLTGRGRIADREDRSPAAMVQEPAGNPS